LGHGLDGVGLRGAALAGEVCGAAADGGGGAVDAGVLLKVRGGLVGV